MFHIRDGYSLKLNRLGGKNAAKSGTLGLNLSFHPAQWAIFGSLPDSPYQAPTQPHMPTNEIHSQHIVLTLEAHGGATREQAIYGGPLAVRALNVTGRWSSTGNDAVPLLTWPDMKSAAYDAQRASAARGRPVVTTSLGGASFGRTVPFSLEHEAALFGYLPYSVAAAKKLEAECRKLFGYAGVLLAGERAGGPIESGAALEAMKAAARDLRDTGVGNGSWVSAAQGLTGKRALELAARVMDGELSPGQGMTPADLLKALNLAKKFA